MQAGTVASNDNQFLKWLAQYQQQIKWLVYALLVLNGVYYGFDDWRAAQATITETSTFMEIAAAYATTMGVYAWLAVLFMLEFETYWMEDENYSRSLYWAMQAFRVICYVLIGHILYAYVGTMLDAYKAELQVGVTSFCSFAGQDMYHVFNLLYDPITAANCASFDNGEPIYRFPTEPSVTTLTGYRTELAHAWVDVLEMIGWLTISFSIMAIIYIQDKGVFSSSAITRLNWLQIVAYVMLGMLAIYWAFYEFYVYTWDILLWIGGFAAIDANLSDWRDELREENTLPRK